MVHRSHGALVVAVLGVPACGELLDVDAFELTDAPDAGSGGAGAVDAAMPASAQGTPFFTATCTACLASSCSDELQTCEANEECASLLACLDRCRDPGCWLECAQVGSYSFSAWPLGSLDTCMFSGCVEPCRTEGGNFDCSNKWRKGDLYSPNEPITVQVQVEQALRETPLPGWTLRACGGTSDCVDSVAPEATDDFGVATFELRSSRDGKGYEGYFQTTDPEPDADGLQLTYRLWRDDIFTDFWDSPLLFLVDPERVIFGIYEAAQGHTPPPDLGALIVTRNFDCHYVPTIGLVAEVIPISGPGVARPDEIVVVYGGPDGTVAIPSYLAIGAPPGRYAITIELRDTGEIYRQLEWEIEAGVIDMQSALLPEQIEF